MKAVPRIERCEACSAPILRDPTQPRRCAGCVQQGLAAAIGRVVAAARAARPARAPALEALAQRTGAA